MSDIIIREIPENVSFRDIRNLLLEAHKAAGFAISTSNLTEAEWQERIRTGGTVITALDGDRLVGTITLSLEQLDKWYAKGTAARCRYVAVSPQYMHRHIASRMIDACAAWCREHDIPYLFWTTAIHNHAAIKTCENNGFEIVDYYYYPNEDHITVGLVRWLQKKPAGFLKRFRFCLKRKRLAEKRLQQSIRNKEE